MKYFKVILLSAVLVITSIALSSCSGNNNSSSTEKQEKQGKEYTSAYVCPMHCTDSGSDKAGTCPVCGMDYEKNKDHKGDGHTH